MKQEKNDIEQLFKQHYNKMYNLARSFLYDVDESKDVVSEVFTHLLQEQIVLHSKSEEAYLMRCIRNRCLNLIAHKSMRDKVKHMLIDDKSILLYEEDNERVNLIMQIIDKLEPPIRKQILILRFLQEMSYQGIAEEIGVSRVTVYNHLSQAMDYIREHVNHKKGKR